MNRMMRWFEFGHLPEDLTAVSALIAATAKTLDGQLPETAEKTAGMRKLLEAKDCFVRAKIESKD